MCTFPVALEQWWRADCSKIQNEPGWSVTVCTFLASIFDEFTIPGMWMGRGWMDGCVRVCWCVDGLGWV